VFHKIRFTLTDHVPTARYVKGNQDAGQNKQVRIFYLCNPVGWAIFANTQGRNDGGKGHNSLGAESLRGPPNDCGGCRKVPQYHKYFLQYSTFGRGDCCGGRGAFPFFNKKDECFL